MALSPTTTSFLSPVDADRQDMQPSVSMPRIDFGPRTPTRRPVFQPTALTQEEYLAGPVDFYTQTLGTGIDVDTGDEEDQDQQEDGYVAPNILGGGDEVSRSVLEQTLGGGSQPSYGSVTMYGVNDVNFDQMSFTPDLTNSGFENLAKNTYASLAASGAQVQKGIKEGNLLDALYGTPTAKGPFGTQTRAIAAPGALTAALGIMGAGPFGALAAIGGAANMAIQAENAAAFKATGGVAGALMDVGGMMVSRAPGSLTYSGNLQGLNDQQMAAIEGLNKGFVPGTLKPEVYDEVTGTWKPVEGTRSMMDSATMSEVGGTYDPTTGKFVDSFGNVSSTGTKKAAQALADTFNSKIGSSLTWSDVNSIRGTVSTDFFGNVRSGPTFQQAYTDAAINSAMQNTGLSRSQLESVVEGGDFIVSGTGVGVNSRGFNTFSDFRGSSEEEDDAPDVGPTSTTAPAESRYSDVGDDSGGGGDDGGGQDDTGGGYSDDTMGYEGGFDLADGGRVGMQQGGPAGFAQRPEFVGGKQSQPDGVSVADDQPRDVQEGSFVINAAAADFAGRDDIEKMIRTAYKKVGGIGQTGRSQEVAINVSKGEVIIPAQLAKVIGYDRLNKINNRGKKEIARRQEAAGGGFIDRKKFAKGDVVLPSRKPKKEALADVELRADIEEFIQADPLARLGWNLYENRDVNMAAIVLSGREGTEVGIGGQYFPKEGQGKKSKLRKQWQGFISQQNPNKRNILPEEEPSLTYFTGKADNYGRYDDISTMLHELRHHALRYMQSEYDVPLTSLPREETLMDFQDYANRKEARKVKASIPEKHSEKDKEQRSVSAWMSPSVGRDIAKYQEIAKIILKERKVPPYKKPKKISSFMERVGNILGF